MKCRKWLGWAVISMTTYTIRVFVTDETQQFTFKPENPNERFSKYLKHGNRRCTYKLLTLKKIWDIRKKATSQKYHLDIYKHSNQRILKWKRSCFINFVYFFFSLQVTVITTYSLTCLVTYFPIPVIINFIV